MYTIRTLDITGVARLLPLNAMVQQVHSDARPANFRADLNADEVCAFFTDWMGRENVRVLIAEDEAGRALGYVMLEAQDIARSTFNMARRRGFVHHIAVLPDVRRQGVGSALLQAGRDWFLACGMTQWATSYWLFNSASAGLMARHGLAPAHVVAESPL